MKGKKMAKEGENKRTVKIGNVIVVSICAVFLFITTLIFVNLFSKAVDEVSSLKQTIVEKDTQIKNLNVELVGKNGDISVCQTEILKSKNETQAVINRLEGIKDKDDLLKRDIFLYIDRKFQLIPKTISQEIANQILIVSKRETVSPELIVGIIQVESAFNPMAISKKNARGLMQVMPEWAKKFGLEYVSDLHDIDTNINSGVKVLKIHIAEAKGSITKGLYYYVGKSDDYAGKVYEAMGKFVAFRSTIDDSDQTQDQEQESDEGEKPTIETSKK